MSQLALIGVVLVTGMIAAAIALHTFDRRHPVPAVLTPKHNAKLRPAVDPSFIATVGPTQHADRHAAKENHPTQGRGSTSVP